MSMNIYAEPGTVVIYTGAEDGQVSWGGCADPRGVLIEGHKYTIRHTEVHSWHTKVYIEEAPGGFNSVHFDEYEEQCIDGDPSYGSGLNPGEYIGETPVKQHETTDFVDYDNVAWALEFIEMYGQIDGAHHKAWVLDQVARILLDTPVNIVQAKWKSGYSEYRVSTGEPTPQYHRWVKKMLGNEVGGEYEYDYDEGIAP